MERHGLMSRPQSRNEGKSNRPCRDIAHGSKFSAAQINSYILAHAKDSTGVDLTPEKIGRWLEHNTYHVKTELFVELATDLPKVPSTERATFPGVQREAHVISYRKFLAAQKVGGESKGAEMVPMDSPNFGWNDKTLSDRDKTIVFHDPIRKGGGNGGNGPSLKAETDPLFEAFKAGKLTANQLAEKIAGIQAKRAEKREKAKKDK